MNDISLAPLIILIYSYVVRTVSYSLSLRSTSSLNQRWVVATTNQLNNTVAINAHDITD